MRLEHRRQVPLSKDEALAAVQRSKVLKGLSIHGQVGIDGAWAAWGWDFGEIFHGVVS